MSGRTIAIIAGAGIIGFGLASTYADDSEPTVNPSVRQGVDNMEADRDCAGLQAAFDRHDAADTLRYIDDALNAAGCYD